MEMMRQIYEERQIEHDIKLKQVKDLKCFFAT